jgi:excinuclease ABC subunit A
MPIEEAADFFQAIPAISRHLTTLNEVGLGYVRLGQPAPTLSGGEAQRVKLASELQKRSTGRTVYVLDEPTTGLHFEDIRKLLGVLGSLVYKGNSVLVIEHNLDVIKTADWIVDLGPDGGRRGGTLVAQGTPEEVAKNPASYTGEFLAEILHGRAAKPSAKAAASSKVNGAKAMTKKRVAAKKAPAKKVAAKRAAK